MSKREQSRVGVAPYPRVYPGPTGSSRPPGRRWGSTLPPSVACAGAGPDPEPEAEPDESDGVPLVVARANGWPLELRVWRGWPRGVADAIRHPSGIWVALRALDAPAFG